MTYALHTLAVQVHLVAALFSGVQLAGQNAPESDTPIIDEFEIGTVPDLIVVPVRIQEQSYRFLLDTDSYFSAASDAVRTRCSGAETRASKLPSRVAVGDVYLGLSQLSLPDGIAGIDASSEELQDVLSIDGVLGMDALSQLIIQIDFAEGKLRVLKSVPSDPGEKVSLQFGRTADAVPRAVGVIPGAAAERFRISTSFDGDVCLRKALFHELIQREAAQVFDGRRNLPATPYVATLSELRFGSLSQSHVAVACHSANCVGLEFLARFVVTLDVPSAAIYLKPRAQPNDKAGAEQEIDLVNLPNFCIVTRIARASDLYRGGLRCNDRIHSINGVLTETFRRAGLIALLVDRTRTLELVIQRASGEIVDMTVPLSCLP